MSEIQKAKIDRSVLDEAEKWMAQCYKPETETWFDVRDTFAKAIVAERNRCLSIIKSIEPRNPSEAHLLETIARRVRGEIC